VYLLGIGFELKVQPGFTHTYELVRHLEFGRHVFKMLWIDNFELFCIKHFGLIFLL